MCSTTITDVSRPAPIIRAVYKVESVTGKTSIFRVAFKPVATVLMEQHTVNIDGVDTTLKARGRHDPCVLPRAVPIVEAMTAMTLLDYYLIDRTTQL